jgi:hypothetical protein
MICITGNANMPRSGVPRMSLAFESSLSAHPRVGSTLVGRGTRHIMVVFGDLFSHMQIGWVVYGDRWLTRLKRF